MEIDEIKRYLSGYIKDFGEINDLDRKIEDTRSQIYEDPILMKVKPYENDIFLLERLIREDLKEKGLKNGFAQDIIIFNYVGEVHHEVENYFINALDEYLHVVYEAAIEIFGDDLKELLNKNPIKLFEEKVGTIQTQEQLYVYNLLKSSENF